MTQRLRNLTDQRATAWEAYQACRASWGDTEPTAEQEATARAHLDDVERLSVSIADEERANRLDAVNFRDVESSGGEARGGESSDDELRAQYESAFCDYLRHGASELEPEQRRLLNTRFLNPAEMRAQGVATGGAGGYTVPQGFLNRMTETMLAYGGVMQFANVINTDSGNPLVWPSNDDTGNVGALLAENTQVAEQDLTIGQKTLGAYMYTSKLIRASIQFLQDSATNPDSFIARKQGERLGRIMATHLATGDGSSKPYGVVNLGIGKTGASGQVATVTYDDLIDLIHSVDPAYRQQGNLRWFMNDATLAAIRKLKDDQNRPLWEPSLQVGEPDRLLGYPVTIDNGIAVMAASAKSILFGDLGNALVVRLVNGATVMRLTERYADYLQVGFLGFRRMDAVLDDSAAAKWYRNAAS